MQITTRMPVIPDYLRIALLGLSIKQHYYNIIILLILVSSSNYLSAMVACKSHHDARNTGLCMLRIYKHMIQATLFMPINQEDVLSVLAQGF
jgi:hypothetical protein